MLAWPTTVLPDDPAVQIPRIAKRDLVPLPLQSRAGAGLVSDSAAFLGRAFAPRSYPSAYGLVQGFLIVNVHEHVDVSRVQRRGVARYAPNPALHVDVQAVTPSKSASHQ